MSRTPADDASPFRGAPSRPRERARACLLVASAFAVGVVCALLTGCADKPPVRTERDPFADFSRYRTYAWIDAPTEPSPGHPDPARGMIAWRVRTAVDAQLSARGYAPADPGEADLLVALRSAVEERHANTLGAFMRYREAGGSEPIDRAFTFGYEVLTLTVELFDAASRQLVWRGMGVVALDARDRDTRAAAAVTEMFAQQPLR